MHHFKVFCFYSFFFSLFTFMSVWTYPAQARRGLASTEHQQFTGVARYHYSPSYKL